MVFWTQRFLGHCIRQAVSTLAPCQGALTLRLCWAQRVLLLPRLWLVAIPEGKPPFSFEDPSVLNWKASVCHWTSKFEIFNKIRWVYFQHVFLLGFHNLACLSMQLLVSVQHMDLDSQRHQEIVSFLAPFTAWVWITFPAIRLLLDFWFETSTQTDWEMLVLALFIIQSQCDHSFLTAAKRCTSEVSLAHACHRCLVTMETEIWRSHGDAASCEASFFPTWRLPRIQKTTQKGGKDGETTCTFIPPFLHPWCFQLSPSTKSGLSLSIFFQ